MNPLSRKRLDETLSYIDFFDTDASSTDPAMKTIRAALKFLLEPEVTEEMIDSAGVTPQGVTPRGGIDYTRRQLPKQFKAMIAKLTADDEGV